MHEIFPANSRVLWRTRISSTDILASSLSFRQDPNQLIRASALRVLSSIRVPIIVPIMMLAIKESASDMSPYVRKTSAHAIQKLYRYSGPSVSRVVSQRYSCATPTPLPPLKDNQTLKQGRLHLK